MKDSLLLLATGAGASVVAWAFWRYLGNNGFSVLNILFVVYLSVDNVRLRRQLRERKTKD
jgi:hypothetical protein